MRVHYNLQDYQILIRQNIQARSQKQFTFDPGKSVILLYGCDKAGFFCRIFQGGKGLYQNNKTVDQLMDSFCTNWKIVSQHGAALPANPTTGPCYTICHYILL